MIEYHGQRFELIKGRQYLQGIISGKIADEHREHIKRIFENYGQMITKEMETLVSTGSRSGRTYYYKGIPYVASASGEPPAKRSGLLAESFGYSASYFELRIWNNAKTYDGKPYPLFIEEGTRNMNLRPYFLIIIAKYEGQIKESLSEYMGL